MAYWISSSKMVSIFVVSCTMVLLNPYLFIFIYLCCCRETHAHADHLTASQYLKKKLGGQIPVSIGEHIKKVQATFAPIYGIRPAALENTFDILYKDNDEFKVGNLLCQVIHLPGHTPDHVGYVIGMVVFTGDSIFSVSLAQLCCTLPLNIENN